MSSLDSNSVRTTLLGEHREVILMILGALGLFVAVSCGSLLSDLIPRHAAWLFAAAYAVPSAAMATAFWLITRRL